LSSSCPFENLTTEKYCQICPAKKPGAEKLDHPFAGPGSLRFVTHHDIDDAALARALEALDKPF
jgi:hypothetical protein